MAGIINMNKLIKPILFFGVIFGWGLCFAQSPIFLPVDDEKAKEVSEYNKYFLMRQLYFSKRYRIVEVDAELLKSSKNITLNFFEDINIPLNREAIKKGSGSLTWLGQMQFGEDEGVVPEGGWFNARKAFKPSEACYILC